MTAGEVGSSVEGTGAETGDTGAVVVGAEVEARAEAVASAGEAGAASRDVNSCQTATRRG